MTSYIQRINLKTILLLKKQKEEVREKLKEKIGDKKLVEKAIKDPHSRRKPLPCGLTIHPAYGCSYACRYCYIYSMGLTKTPVVNPLSPEMLSLSLAVNPYFIPSIQGTLLAFGSITEPFINKEVTRKTIDYMKTIRTLYGNPIQVSTKALLSNDEIENIRKDLSNQISFLITITTLTHYKKIEPNAPPPMKRFEIMKKLIDKGIPTYLFLRPIIPGIIEQEIHDILVKTKANNARGIVIGSLRVTPGIISELEKAGIDIEKIIKRINGELTSEKRQVTVKTLDIKEKIVQQASKMGLRVFPSACAANIDAHELGCWACRHGPCGQKEKIPSIENMDIIEILEYHGMKPIMVETRKNTIIITTNKRKIDEKTRIGITWLETLSKRKIVLKKK